MSSILPGEVSLHIPGTLAHDSFGFNKIAIVATKRGRVYGIDVGDQGRVAWSTKAFELPAGKEWDVKGIWVEKYQRGCHDQGADGEYIILRTTTGEKVEATGRGTRPPIASVAVVDSASGKWFLPIGADGDPGEVPSAWAPKDIVIVQGANGEIRGLKFETDSLNAKPNVEWTFRPALGQRVTSIVSRSAHDPVASIGRVLGDRTVHYKYLNPNIVLVTAVSDVASTASFYLLDGVSGDIPLLNKPRGY